MTDVDGAEKQSGQGLSITSMVLGILAILTFIVPFLAVILGILAVIFGIISLKKPGRNKAITGIITGAIGIVLGIVMMFVVFMAIPVLQKSARDTARKNDVAYLSVSVTDYMTDNRGQLPFVSSLSASNLTQVTSVTSAPSPSTTMAVYKRGTSCDGVSGVRAYSLTILLENGSLYCQGS